MFCSKILVAYDGSELGRKALNTAVNLAGTDKSIVLHVVHAVMFPIMSMGYPEVSFMEIKENMILEGNESMKSVKEILEKVPNESHTAVLDGSPAERILDYAKKHHCDLIVAGSRGLSGMKEFFLGSVSHNVVQHSPVPVLIVK